MKRKQIYISEKTEAAVKDLAVLRGVAEAVIIREALQQYVAKSSRRKSAHKKKSKRENPLRKLIGLIKDGPRDAVKNLDHYLYGAPKKK